MSYCRFSDDNWRSDVYSYESIEGYMCHVASYRFAEDAPPLPILTSDNIEEYEKAYKKQIKHVASSEKIEIGSPYDGGSYTFENPSELLDFFFELQKNSYHVPQFAIESVREECTFNNDKY